LVSACSTPLGKGSRSGLPEASVDHDVEPGEAVDLGDIPNEKPAN